MLQRWTPNMWIFRLIEVTTAQWRATADADGTPIGDRAHSGHSRWPTGGHSMRRWTGQSEKQICSPILGLCLGASWMSTKSIRDGGQYKQALTWTLYMNSTNWWTIPPKRTLIHWCLVDQLWRTLSSQLRTFWSIGTLAPESDSGTPGGHWDTKMSLRAFQFSSGNLTKGWDLILLQIGTSLCRRVHEKKKITGVQWLLSDFSPLW